MKAIRRRLFNGAAILSFLLLLATGADRLVQQYYFHWLEVLTWHVEGQNTIVRGLAITTCRGSAILTAYVFSQKTAAQPPLGHIGYGASPSDTWTPNPGKTFLERVGFAEGYHTHVRSAKYSANWGVNRDLSVPVWFLAVLFAVLPAVAIRRWRNSALMRWRLRNDLCPHCGYDLRATPQRCPECGTIPAPKEEIASA